jgi:hypothetical protein
VDGQTFPIRKEGLAFFGYLDEERQLRHCKKVGSYRFMSALGYVVERGVTLARRLTWRGDLPSSALYYVCL